MTRTRKWVLGTAGLVVLVLVAGWFLLISPKRADAADAQTATAAQEATNQGLRQKVAILQQAQKDKPAQDARIAALALRIPSNPQLPALIRQLNAIAASAGVGITTVMPSNPAGVNVVAPVYTGVAAGSGYVPNTILEQMSLGVTAEGDYFEIERFVNQIEGLQRASLVTGLNFKVTGTAAPGAQSGGSGSDAPYSAVITMRTYLTAPAPAVPAPAGAATPAPASPTTVS